MAEEENDLDPRIQVELENLNTATDEINKLEIELEESNSTFRILLNESTRRLKLLSKKLGSCIEKARPFHEATEKARLAQIECQAAAVKFQRANEIHSAAKETVALAEQRFMSNSHEWQFDNAWQEMLNHATLKVTDAEKAKADYHLEHQQKAQIFSAAEMKVQQLEDRFRRSINKSRPYFEEKQICQDQLQTQKERIQELQSHIQRAKVKYSTSLRNLEQISEEIHKKRGDLSQAAPPGPREPGVGAELNHLPELRDKPALLNGSHVLPLPDFASELDKCEIQSHGNVSCATSSAVSEKGDESDFHEDADLDLEVLRQKVKVLAVRPMEGGDGQQEQQKAWENELNATVDQLDHLMMMRERTNNTTIGTPANTVSANMLLSSQPPATGLTSLPMTPIKKSTATQVGVMAGGPIKMLQKAEPLPNTNVSMRELPLLARISNEIIDKTQRLQLVGRRRRSLE